MMTGIKKRGPQFDKIMTSERLDSILNGSLEVMFNQLTPEDFASDMDDSIELSAIVDGIVNKTSEQKIMTNVKKQDSTIKNKNDRSADKNDRNCLDYKASTNSFARTDEKVSRKNEQEECDQMDEFDCLVTSYVPLHMRIGQNKQQSNSKNRKSLSPIDKSKNRFSLGIESFLDATD